jgi:membrane-bound metal-dependent hydrolase YbcI (DUF457 family)
MPSPIAHAALVFVARPVALRDRKRSAGALGWTAALAFLLCLPDIDFVLGRVTGLENWSHGGATHSLAFGLIAGVLFGLAAGAISGARSPRRVILLCTLGVACVWSHLLMDTVTYKGRGLMLLWPWDTQRFRLPCSIFYGARHSTPGAWYLHLITLTTELAFGAVVWLLGRRLSERRRAEKDT